ncbi:MAG: Type secretion-associated serine protease mycosin [Streptosporangiaceae bacterium]|nr:Type secretion-associated serine protease mycosin [Streptosporangiaceae bacterium]
MRRMTRVLAAAGVSSVLALITAMPAAATAVPRGRDEQWWFTTWDIENKVWPITKGAGVTVAVIDTGVNSQLPDLNGVVIPGADLENGGGDGRMDTDTKDGGHGTGMAALIASQGTTTGFVGVAPEAKIMPIVATGGDTVKIAKGVRYATDHGAKVVNISQGSAAPSGQCLPQIQEAVGYAIQHDVVVVSSAGNEGDTLNSAHAPSVCAGVLSVGAIDYKNRAWVKTQRQPYVTVAAPGVSVGSIGRDGKFIPRLEGTSQASALTSATAALLRSKFPQMSAREVVQRITNTTVDAGPQGKDNMTGYGTVVPIFALTRNVPKSAPNPVFEKFDQWQATQPKQAQTPGAQPQGAEQKEDSGPSSTLIVLGFFGGLTVLIVVGAILMARRSGGRNRGAGPQQFGPGGPQPGTPPSFGAPPAQGAPPEGARPDFRPPAGQVWPGPTDQGPSNEPRN